MAIQLSSSTLQSFKTIQEANNRSQVKFTKGTLALASGFKVETYAEDTADTGVVLASADQKERSAFFLENNKRLINTIGTYVLSLDKCNRILKDFYVLCKAANNAATDSTVNFPLRLQQLEDEFVATLNGKDTDGNYLFSGIQTDRKPVDMTGYPQYDNKNLLPKIPDPLNPGGPLIDNPDFIGRPNYQELGYYKGSDQTLPVILMDDLPPLDFRLKADAPAFEKMLRAFEGAKVIDLGPPQKGENIGVIEDIIVQALSELNDSLLASLGQAESCVNDLIDQLGEQVIVSENEWGDAASIDLLVGIQNYQLAKMVLDMSSVLVSNLIKAQRESIEALDR